MSDPNASHYLRLADLAVQALLAELELFPKSGLVSTFDQGSHKDMDHLLFRVSAESLRDSFQELAAAGVSGCSFEMGLVPIGIQAENRMMRATHGINTHRGAIFSMGLLVAASAWVIGKGRNPEPVTIQNALLELWGDGLRRHADTGSKQNRSHFLDFQSEHDVGAREEAARGFPSIFQLALPRLDQLTGLGFCSRDSRLEVFFLLMSSVGDTNLLHRGGIKGADFARRRSLDFLEKGGVAHPEWESLALKIHYEFVEKNLSPGGVADLLAGTLFLQSLAALPNAT